MQTTRQLTVTLAAVGGGAVAMTALHLLGTPITVICLLAAIAIAHACGWRLTIVRKRPGIIDL